MQNEDKGVKGTFLDVSKKVADQGIRLTCSAAVYLFYHIPEKMIIHKAVDRIIEMKFISNRLFSKPSAPSAAASASKFFGIFSFGGYSIARSIHSNLKEAFVINIKRKVSTIARPALCYFLGYKIIGGALSSLLITSCKLTFRGMKSLGRRISSSKSDQVKK